MTTTARGGDSPAVAHAGGAPTPELLRTELEELGLSPYEARVLLALLRLGSATTAQLETLADIPRTSIYKVLNSLAVKRLAERLPVEGSALWASVASDQVAERLYEAQEDAHAERLTQLRDRSRYAHQLLVESFADAPSVALPQAHFLFGAAQMKRTYEQLLAEAESELVMFTRPPYAWRFPNPNRAVLDMLSRGVSARVLYVAKQWQDPAAEAFRTEMDVYHQAGVQARLAERLPIKLVVVDRSKTLVNLADAAAPEGGYPNTLLVEHLGYAEVQAAAFEQYWQAARPLPGH